MAVSDAIETIDSCGTGTPRMIASQQPTAEQPASWKLSSWIRRQRQMWQLWSFSSGSHLSKANKP